MHAAAPAGDWCLSLAPICKHSNYPPRLISILPGMRSAGVQWRSACKTMTVALGLLASHSGHVTMQWPPGPEMAAQGWPVTRGSHSSYPRCRAHSSAQVAHQLRELMFTGIIPLEYVRGEKHIKIFVTLYLPNQKQSSCSSQYSQACVTLKPLFLIFLSALCT